jgi:hypothetical protein
MEKKSIKSATTLNPKSHQFFIYKQNIMKNFRIFHRFLLLAALFSGFVFTGCKSKQKLAKIPGEELIEVYCTGPEFFSNAEYFRASNMGESIDQATAKKKAMSNARADLASSIETTIKGVIDNYLKSSELNNVEEAEERYESLTREVIHQKLNGIQTICEKTTRTTEGKYKTYIALQLGGDDLFNAINERLGRDAQLKIDYDYEKFKETFNEEMKKLEEQRGIN